MNIRHFRELQVYQNAKRLALRIYERSKEFPPEEKFSLTDQIRRSSRSVCTNTAEAWRKRRYEAAFTAKLSDAETEGAETQVWLEFAFEIGFVTEDQFQELDAEYERVLGQIVTMIDHPEKWVLRPRKARN